MTVPCQSFCTDISEQPGIETNITFTRVSHQALETLKLKDPALLRGTPLSQVLRSRARILADRPCTERHYSLSAPVDHIDAFISHNWSTPRHDKFLALSLHFNLLPAVAVASAVSCCAFLLTINGVIPHGQEVFMDETHSQGFWCQILGMTAFVLSLLFWHELRARLPFKESLLFLDKACVHQTDMDLKRQGIESLPALLSYSWRMVVLYSDVYLQKLWTVYELATFLLLFPEGNLQVLPISFPRVVLGMMFLICLSRLFFGLYFLPGTQQFLDGIAGGPLLNEVVNIQTIAVDFPIMCVLTLVCERWAREQADIHKRVEGFSISQATCLREEDRRIVERNVAAFSRHFGLVPSSAGQLEALRTFDDLVHQQVPRLLRASMGRVGVPYRHSVMMFAVYLPYMLDSIAGRILDDAATVHTLLCVVMWCTMVVFAIGPLSVALSFVLAQRLLDLQGAVYYTAFLAVTLLVLFTFVGGCVYVANPLFVRGTHSTKMLLVYGAFTALLVVITLQVYRRPRMTTVRRRLDEAAAATLAGSFGTADMTVDSEDSNSSVEDGAEDDADEDCSDGH